MAGFGQILKTNTIYNNSETFKIKCLGAIKDWPGVTWPRYEQIQLSDEAAGVHQSVLAYLCWLLSCRRLFALQLRLRNDFLQTLRYPSNHPFSKEETHINNCEWDFTGH